MSVSEPVLITQTFEQPIRLRRASGAVFDWDDHHPGNDAMPWMHKLKEINPAFKATLFAVPGLGSPDFWDAHPDWIELAAHGWMHGGPECNDAHECVDWTYTRMGKAIIGRPAAFTYGFKAPGWQISDACYLALRDHGWWVADQHLEDGRRPKGLRTYFYEDGDDRWHGHVQNVCGNGLQETWDVVCAKVAAATDFKFCSEATVEWA